MIRKLVLIALVLLAGCLGGGTPSDEAQREDVSDHVERFVDNDAGVVCWIYSDGSVAPEGQAGGISCIPLEQTDLAR